MTKDKMSGKMKMKTAKKSAKSKMRSSKEKMPMGNPPIPSTSKSKKK